MKGEFLISSPMAWPRLRSSVGRLPEKLNPAFQPGSRPTHRVKKISWLRQWPQGLEGGNEKSEWTVAGCQVSRTLFWLLQCPIYRDPQQGFRFPHDGSRAAGKRH